MSYDNNSQEALIHGLTFKPNWADGVDDVFGLKAVTLGEARLACGATTQGQAFLEQPGAGSQMNCPIHTIATIEAFIRRIDNCVNTQIRVMSP